MQKQQQPERPPPLLEFKAVNTYYGELHVLKDVDYYVGQGEIVCLLGGNASGKSTTMKTILGIVRPESGTVVYAGDTINTMRTADRVKRGIAPVPEARRLFPRMTVAQNLDMGAYTRNDKAEIAADRDRVFGLFPLYVPPLFPTLLRTTGAGFSYNVGRLAAAVGTVVFGILAVKIDLNTALEAIGFVYIPGLLIACFIPEPNAKTE